MGSEKKTSVKEEHGVPRKEGNEDYTQLTARLAFLINLVLAGGLLLLLALIVWSFFR